MAFKEGEGSADDLLGPLHHSLQPLLFCLSELGEPHCNVPCHQQLLNYTFSPIRKYRRWCAFLKMAWVFGNQDRSAETLVPRTVKKMWEKSVQSDKTVILIELVKCLYSVQRFQILHRTCPFIWINVSTKKTSLSFYPQIPGMFLLVRVFHKSLYWF